MNIVKMLNECFIKPQFVLLTRVGLKATVRAVETRKLEIGEAARTKARQLTVRRPFAVC
jgi:hypothetical protein